MLQYSNFFFNYENFIYNFVHEKKNDMRMYDHSHVVRTM